MGRGLRGSTAEARRRGRYFNRHHRRLIDYYKQGIYQLDKIDVVVLDEADRMFDLGFIKDIRYMFNKMPSAKERQSMLFSATLSQRVQERTTI